MRFDLVIVDEAQCLRHIDDQQTNTVLSRLLKNRVDNWLFLSATPVHSGVKDIATVLNQYAGQQELIPQACLTDLDLLKRTLANFMVRRPRTFLVDGKHIHKREYRVDDTESLKLRCENPLGLLSIALVQKHLARTMGARGGKFRNGYIASFESLEDSLRDRVSPSHTRAESAAQEIGDTDDQQENGNDFFSSITTKQTTNRLPTSNSSAKLAAVSKRRSNSAYRTRRWTALNEIWPCERLATGRQARSEQQSLWCFVGV
ncbi:hypothetical protein AAFM48_08130 [Burkholderia pseudomallei]